MGAILPSQKSKKPALSLAVAIFERQDFARENAGR
jgi:hypothetical protein